MATKRSAPRAAGAAKKTTAKKVGAARGGPPPGAGSAAVSGISLAPAEHAAAAAAYEPFRQQKASWARGKRFPVVPDEFIDLKTAAAAPRSVRSLKTAPTMALTDDAVEQDPEAAAESVENPSEFEAMALAPTTTGGFDGPGHTRWQPPDCTIAAGPRDVLVAVNTDLLCYTKSTGALRFRWADFGALFNAVLPKGAGVFDPRVAFDHYANRWIVVLASTRESPRGAWILLGVSQTDDPGGEWWVWATDSSVNGSNATTNWADYPMLGFDTQGIYVTGNMFPQVGKAFQYAKLRIFNKAELYAGGVGGNHSIRWWDYWDLRNPDNTKAFTVQPAVHLQGLGGNPNAYLVSSRFGAGSSLTLWTLSDPLALWSGRTPSLAKKGIAVASYDIPPDALQRGQGAPRIATNDTRLLNAVFQSNSGTQRLWAAHTIAHTWPGEREARSIIRWYEIDVPSAGIVQTNGFGRAGSYYYYPAIQTDIGRHAHLVFGRSSDTEFAHSRQTGRRTTDAANTLQSSVAVSSGTSTYTGDRWGDYFGICRDPRDTFTVWMFGEHAGAGGNWSTRVASTRF